MLAGLVSNTLQFQNVSAGLRRAITAAFVVSGLIVAPSLLAQAPPPGTILVMGYITNGYGNQVPWGMRWDTDVSAWNYGYLETAAVGPDGAEIPLPPEPPQPPPPPGSCASLSIESFNNVCSTVETSFVADACRGGAPSANGVSMFSPCGFASEAFNSEFGTYGAGVTLFNAEGSLMCGAQIPEWIVGFLEVFPYERAVESANNQAAVCRDQVDILTYNLFNAPGAGNLVEFGRGTSAAICRRIQSQQQQRACQ